MNGLDTFQVRDVAGQVDRGLELGPVDRGCRTVGGLVGSLFLLGLRRWLGNDVIVLLWGQLWHQLMAVSSLDERGGGVLFYD
jgi:hypothetical protein